MKRAVFLSIAGDHHASVVGQTLLERCGEGLRLSIIDMDERSVKGGFVWRITSPGAAVSPALIKDNAGDWVSLDETDLIWCRRFARAQRGGDDAGFLTDQWNAAGWSLAHAARTRWIDRPRDIIDAENKALQLRCAHEVGFRVPRTLISQDFEHIRAFARSEPEGIIVKPLKASIRKQIYTVDLTQEALARPDGFSAFPAIYQQKIGGDRHWRIVCLPDATIVFAIRSPELDWRRTRNIDIETIETDSVIAERCGSLMRTLNLTMGIIDAKVVGDDIYFLEINPQGQFLFLEALSGVNLRNAYADYFRQAIFCERPAA
jgi:glutathione synthase/RimK-type ligase-like ATP-grasp enzyme